MVLALVGAGSLVATIVLQWLLATGRLTFEAQILPVSIALLSAGVWMVGTGYLARATGFLPHGVRVPSPDETARGIVIAYQNANFTVYRAVIDRLRDGERFRMETQFGAYEMSAEEFRTHFPGIVASESYRAGPPSTPGSCYYVVGPPPAEAARFKRS